MTAKANVTGGAMIGTGGKLAPVIADKGDAGSSAYQLWLREGNSGTETQYLAGLASKVPGPSGWSPILAGEADSTRTLIRVVDWTGGAGAKPDVGMYLGTTGYVTTKADAFNFNASKRVMVFSAVTAASTGIATIAFTGANFAIAPTVVPMLAQTLALSGPTRTVVVAGSLTKTGVQVKVEQQAILTGVISALAGATASVIVIEN